MIITQAKLHEHELLMPHIQQAMLEGSTHYNQLPASSVRDIVQSTLTRGACFLIARTELK
jgi:hypothetical protein